ncbi:hypothetical protein B7C42_07281 [Nocardia cerradoensis]|uniref:Uncharacterized protein n=1 Tax=Nocardia cerradoensis TaxID=85688 RepID=A0A231GVG5_9NOCA|nr:hypothetical protein B7C42_07281 [Nocardia cerradoensis]
MAEGSDAPLRELEQALRILINRLGARVPEASPARISRAWYIRCMAA